MNPLQFLYDTVDIIKDDKNGKVSLVYDKVGKQFYVMKERNLRTAEIYSRLKKTESPYLPEIYHAVESDGKFFIVEEFIQGRTLSEILIYNNGLDEKKSAEVLKQLCNALKILHAQKIIHRDIKPSNVMVTKTGAVKLIDFSISRIEKKNCVSDTDFLGTRGYAPPEQYGFGQTDARSDIYSLGITIQKILGENYDGYLKKILEKCTELNPENRYQSVEEIIADIDKKYFRHKIKKATKKIFLAFTAILLSSLAFQKFYYSDKIPASEVKTESNKIEKSTLSTQPQSPPPKYEPKKVEWSEIKIPDTENYLKTEQPAPKIFETNTLEKKENVPGVRSDPRLNRVCTLTLNGNIYRDGMGEIPADIWKTWESDAETVYIPQNFFVNLNLENKDPAPLDMVVSAKLNGRQDTEKIFHVTNLASGQYENFQIPIGGLALSNGSFEVEIWLRKNDGTPLAGFWNGKQFASKFGVKIYLRDYAKWKYRKK